MTEKDKLFYAKESKNKMKYQGLKHRLQPYFLTLL